MIKNYHIKDAKIVECKPEEGSVFVLFAPDENERRELVSRLNIDEHTLGSALDPDELSRVEFEPEHIAIVFKRPKIYKGEERFTFHVTSSGLFLFKDKLYVVQPDDNLLFGGKQFTKISSLKELLLKLVYRSIMHFLEHLKVINTISDELESHVNTSMENIHLISLFGLEKSLVYYLNAINANGVLCEKLKNSAIKIGFSTEEIEYLDDMIVENNQCYRQAEIYSNILASLMDARASIVGNNLNMLMKTLNLITIGIMVPTFVVSAFSMNVYIPLAQYKGAFWMIMLFALVSVGGFMVFWYRKWR